METTATLLRKALTVNSQNVEFSYPDIRNTVPGDDGDFEAGIGSLMAPAQLGIIPYCDGGPGSTFMMRLYGWMLYGSQGIATLLDAPPSNIWVALLLAEFRCVAGSQNGRAGGLIKENEFFASKIELTAGTLGVYGLIVSDVDIAHVKIDLNGPQKGRFDFAAGIVGWQGNALWWKTSICD